MPNDSDFDERGRMRPLFDWRSAVIETDFDSTTKLVALCLSLYMSARGDSAYPGATRLGNDCSLHPRTVRERLGTLVEAGWLDIVERGGLKGEARRANVYAARVPVDNTLGHRPTVTPSASTLGHDRTNPGPQATPTSHELANEDATPRQRKQRGETFLPGSGWVALPEFGVEVGEKLTLDQLREQRKEALKKEQSA